MNEEDIVKTGAIVTEPKPTLDYIVAGSSAPFDWEKGFIVENLPKNVKNQGSSYSCGGQAVSYYQESIDGSEEQSAKFIYSATYAKPDGGTSVDALGSHAKKFGSAKEALCPSYHENGTTDEMFMRINDSSKDALADGAKNKSVSYAKVDTFDIEAIAKAIRDNKGCILGVYGQNNGTWLSPTPKPPVGTSNRWAHWIYAVGAVMHEGKKAIKFVNSWGKMVGEDGYQYLTEEYFPAGIFWAWVLTDPGNVIIPNPKYDFEKPINYGETSLEVEYLQRLLVRLGYLKMPKGVAYGFYGSLTRDALLAFQKDHGITGSDGMNVGPRTRVQLNNAQ